MIKVLTLWQPWALLMALKEKEWETRSWMTTYRGPLAIHAAKNFPKEARELCLREPFCGVLRRWGYTSPDQLPLGAVLAVGWLEGIWPTKLIRQAKFLNPNELAFGDYADGRYAWKVVDVRLVPEPIEVRGHQRLWNWEMPGESIELQMKLGIGN